MQRLGVSVSPAVQPLLRQVAGRAPLLPAALGLLSGIALDRLLAPTALIPLGVLAGAALAMSAPIIRGRRDAMLAILALAAGAGGALLHHRQMRHLPPGNILHFWTGDSTTARVRGTVATPPRLTPPPKHLFADFGYGTSRTNFLLRLDAVDTPSGFHPASGMLRVTIGEPLDDLEQGERIEMFGTLRRFQPPVNPGGFDWALYYRRQGLHAAFSCPHAVGAIRLAPPKADTSRAVESVRRWAAGLLTDDIAAASPEEASLLEAMIIGHRSQLDQRLNDVFVRAGCIHFLAVSGVNVGITMGLAGAIGRLLGLRRRPRTWLMLIAVIMYAIIAEARPPILRATVIGVIYCIARLTGRERATLNWIAATVIALGVIDPAMIFDAGYQLSTAAVLGVIFLGPALEGALKVVQRRLAGRSPHEVDQDDQLIAAVQRDRAQRASWTAKAASSAYRAARTAVVLSLAAWLAAAPVGLVHFQQVQPYGAVNTLLLMPLVTLVMAAGMAKFLIAMFSPWLASFLTPVLRGADAALIAIVEVLADVPGASVNLPAPPWYSVVAYYALLLALIWRYGPAFAAVAESEADAAAPRTPAATSRPRFIAPRLPRLSRRVLLICAGITAAGAIAWRYPAASEGELRITCLAVGRGSSTLIELPDGTAIVYDAGASGPYDPGRGVFLPMLHERGLRRIDAIYVSHPNMDHLSGIPSLIAMVDCGPVVLNDEFVALAEQRSPARRLLDHLDDVGHPVRIGPPAAQWEQGGATFEWLWPPLDDEAGATPTASRPSAVVENDASTVLRIRYAGRSILLTGDIDVETQEALIDRGDLRADVLVLPHHGAVVSSTAKFVAAVDADILIRSTGERMAGTDEALLRIAADRSLYSTADAGAVEVRLGAAGVSVRTMR